MKHLILIILTASSLRATIMDYSWQLDTPTGFSLTLAGVGPVAGTFISPSGLWQLSGGYAFQYMDSLDMIRLASAGEAIYFGGESQPKLRVNGDYSYRSLDLPVVVDNEQWTVNDQEGWNGGSNLFAITSIPDLHDPSTWSWLLHWGNSGQQIPEGGSLVLTLLTLLVLPMWKTKSHNKEQTK